MILTELIAKIREEVDDPAPGKKHTDAVLASRIYDQTNAMVRRLTEINEKYHNYYLTLDAADARQVASDSWEYSLPRFIAKITGVRPAQDSLTSPRMRPIPHVDENRDEASPGWDFAGLHSLRLHRFGEAQTLEIQVAKNPARLTLGSLPDQSGLATNQLRMDSPGTSGNTNAATYPHEREADAYANSVIEIVGTATTLHPVESQIRVVKSSLPSEALVGYAERFTVLTLDADWDEAPVEGDTYEMHAEVPDEHLRLLVLLVARASFARKGNTDEIRAILGELNEQWDSFVRHNRPRQFQHPAVIKDDLGLSPDSLRNDLDLTLPYW